MSKLAGYLLILLLSIALLGHLIFSTDLRQQQTRVIPYCFSNTTGTAEMCPSDWQKEI